MKINPKGADVTTATKKRTKTTSPTQRTLAELKRLGFRAQVVERWNSFAKVRQDLFGIVDVVAMLPGVGIVGVQATSRTNHAARRTKSLAEPALRTWLESGGRFEVWSWDKMGAAGSRKLWRVWREELKLEHLPAA